jgi:DNA-binding IscR family transcriptional regulator
MLAKSVNTNAAFLRQLLGRLRDAGLVEMTMGKNGGAVLARPAPQLSLADVYAAVEPAAPAQLHTSEPFAGCPVGRNILPLLDGVMQDVERAALGRLAGVTIAGLAQQVQRRG